MQNLIFISHIHEEGEMAKIIKDAIEDEFSGFVDVFVSSDGVTIPSGSNLLKSIENGLKTCVAAIYLISPNSVKRSWINFELGAVWIRNIISIETNNKEIPTIPFCHSEMKPSILPQPLINLSSIQANKAEQLESAFTSIQISILGKSRKLKTNFNELAIQIIKLEYIYTIGIRILDLLNKLESTKEQVIALISIINNSNEDFVKVKAGLQIDKTIGEIFELERTTLNGIIVINTSKNTIKSTSKGVITVSQLEIAFKRESLLNVSDFLLKSFSMS